jgi:hypothetical protein
MLSKQSLVQQGIHLDSVERIANDMEKDLSRRSEAFKQEYEKKPVTWIGVRSTLKKDEAGIEIVRFRKFIKHWSDTVHYAALIVCQTTKEHPEVVLLENGNELEGEYRKLYRSVTAIGRDILTRGARPEEVETLPIDEGRLYSAYWQQIHQALRGIKRVYLSIDGVYNNINVETLKMPGGKCVGEVLDVRLVTSLRDLVTKRETKKGENVAELFGYPEYDLGLGQQEQLAARLKEETVPKAMAYVDEKRIR